MSISKDNLNELLHKGNKPLTVGIAWSIFGITICPCPVCLMGSLTFLSMGLAEKFGAGRLEIIKAIRTEHHAHCEKCDHAEKEKI
jgi:hypothetical protein